MQKSKKQRSKAPEKLGMKALRDFIVQQTDEYFSRREKKVSTKANRLGALCAPFGCHKEIVKNLVEEITGERVILPPSGGDGRAEMWPLFVCAVPTGNDNSHDYEIGKPCLPGLYLKHNGHGGNHLTKTIGLTRRPTIKEIEDMIVVAERELNEKFRIL